VLQAMLAKLGAEDRVSLIGTDLNPVALSPGFVTPSGAEMAQALKKLIARQPLGSGDMEKALRMAMATFASDVKNNPAIVYIGSGTSLANLLDLKTMAALTAALVEQKAPVNSCPIGPKLDLQMLGVLASDTGGTMVPLKDISATEAGERLARAVRATIVYPVEVVWPAALTEVFPNRTPPLRTDRDTVLVGTYRGSGPLEIRMTADTPSGIRKLVWTLVPGPPQADNAFLEPLVRAVRHHGGLGYPIAGSHVLEEARHEFSFLVPLELARIAASKGDVARAKALAEQAIKGAPDDAPAAAEAYLIRGFAFAQENDLPNAISDCTKAIGLAPKYAAAYRLRGNVHYDRSDFDKAIADYTEAIRLEPGSPRTHYTRGRAYVQRRDFDKAIADFNEAIRLDPRDAKALQARAEAYQAKGDRAKAGADDAKAKATLKGRG